MMECRLVVDVLLHWLIVLDVLQQGFDLIILFLVVLFQDSHVLRQLACYRFQVFILGLQLLILLHQPHHVLL